jgi:ankyrin repeat protein
MKKLTKKQKLEMEKNSSHLLALLFNNASEEEIIEYINNTALINIDVRDKNLNTPLRLAVNRRYNELSKLLIEKGADINIKNIHNNGILSTLIMDSSTELVSFVLDKGINIYDLDERSRYGGFFRCLFDSKDIEIVKMIVNKVEKVDEITLIIEECDSHRTNFHCKRHISSYIEMREEFYTEVKQYLDKKLLSIKLHEELIINSVKKETKKI